MNFNFEDYPHDFRDREKKEAEPRPKAAICLRVKMCGEHTIGNQRCELVDECQRRKWEPVDYCIKGDSVSFPNSPGFKLLMADIKKGQIQAVLCCRLDGLAQSLPDLIRLMDLCASKRVALVMPGQGVDTTVGNPASLLQRNVLRDVVEFEKAMIRDRVRAGKRRGRAWGDGGERPPHGMSKERIFKLAQLKLLLHQTPEITLDELAKCLRVGPGAVWELKQMALRAL